MKSNTPPTKIIDINGGRHVYIFELTEFVEAPDPPIGPIPPPPDPSVIPNKWDALFKDENYTAGRPKPVTRHLVKIIYLLKVTTSATGIIQDYSCEKLPFQ